MTQFTRGKSRYRVTKQAAINALGLTDVQGWEWRPRQLVIVNSQTSKAGNPIPGVTKFTDHWTIVPWEDIQAQFFSSIPDHMFTRITASFDSTYIWFDLNLKES